MQYCIAQLRTIQYGELLFSSVQYTKLPRPTVYISPVQIQLASTSAGRRVASSLGLFAVIMVTLCNYVEGTSYHCKHPAHSV